MKKTKTYMDKLMKNKEFREKFDKEYRNLCVGEKIAEIRHQANLTKIIRLIEGEIINLFKS